MKNVNVIKCKCNQNGVLSIRVEYISSLSCSREGRILTYGMLAGTFTIEFAALTYLYHKACVASFVSIVHHMRYVYPDWNTQNAYYDVDCVLLSTLIYKPGLAPAHIEQVLWSRTPRLNSGGTMCKILSSRSPIFSKHAEFSGEQKIVFEYLHLGFANITLKIECLPFLVKNGTKLHK